MEIAETIAKLHQNIVDLNPDAVIVAATKMQSIDKIREAMGTGLVLASGENRVQEFNEKYVSDFRWDFIGQLQTNKVKYLVGRVGLIHSVDRLSLVETIDKESQKKNLVTDILVEINGGREESKGGLFLEDAEQFLDAVTAFTNVRVRGIMAVAPIYWEEKQLRNTFDEIYKEFVRLKREKFDYLSMGMSNDYVYALQSGANLVRLGRAIFGERNYGII